MEGDDQYVDYDPYEPDEWVEKWHEEPEVQVDEDGKVWRWENNTFNPMES